MLCFPNCKINLGLYITRKRDDGYHNIETVFYPVRLTDVLEIIPATKTTLHTSGTGIAGNTDDNLVYKAYKLLQSIYPDKIPPFDIYLHKTIPMGAGLGGGSADGAFMLRLINDHCKLGLDNSTLAAYALQLGSDCPFFIYNTPQLATGRGEEMRQVDIDLSAYSIQIIYPEVHISTAQAFRTITPAQAQFDLSNLADLPLAQWRDNVSNDFETPIFSQHLVLAEIKKELYTQGAIYASMSGSGSAIYGIFEKGKKAEIVMDNLQAFYIE